VDVGVSWRGAPLAAPSHGTPDDFLGCIGDVGGVVHQRRILAPEFEQHRRQILRRRLHDDLADLGAAGEEEPSLLALEHFGICGSQILQFLL
jgi:hypothetical protein